AGVDRANRAYDTDPAVRARRTALSKRKAELEGGPAVAAKLLRDPAVAAEVAAWEKSQGEVQDRWQVLDPAEYASAGGATPEELPALPVRFGGRRPGRAPSPFEAVPALPAVAGVRLEVLTDDSLPHRGPGRQDNGNLHLSEFKVEAAPASEPG